MRRSLIVFFVLASTQIVGWGSVGFLAVIAQHIADDLRTELAIVFLGTSVMFVAMGIAAPWAGRGFVRFGPRRVMAVGAAAMGGGLCIIAAASSEIIFLLGWAITGVAGAMFLTTSAYVYLADFADDRARGLIGTLMLVTGLAGSVFWPVTAVLDHALGWRGAVFAYAATMVVVVFPLVLFGLPETRSLEAPTDVAEPAATGKGRTFLLIVLAIALNSFVTFGVEAVGIEVFKSMGADLANAVAVASLLGLFKVGGRVIDLLGGRNWNGLSTALVSGAMIPLGLLSVALWGGGFWPLAGYLCLVGIGSGAFAVARATMPLAFYRKADYAAAMSTIALPMNIISAIAPPALAALLVGVGPHAVLGLLAGVSVLAFATLLWLNNLRNASALTGTT